MMYKLLSHNDLDGVSCGILAKLAFGKQVNVRYNSVGGLDREVQWFLDNNKDKDTLLIITDLSVNEENEKKLDEYVKAGGKVQFLDHHKTALHFNDYDWGQVVVEDEEGKLTSATSLLYEYLVKNDYLEPSNGIAEFVELVRQYDTWEWEKNNNLEAQRLNALFFLISIDEFEEKMIDRLLSSDHFYFDEFEKKVLDMEDDKIERYIRRKRRELVQAKMEGLYAGIVYAESYHSELGNELGKEYPHLDFIAILNIGSKRVGFRTIHDHVDVSEFAGLFGGGGHAKASGCTLTDDAYNKFVAETFPLEPLREDAKRNRYNLKRSTFGSLYKTLAEELFFIASVDEQTWEIEKNNIKMDQTFPSFEEAEKYLKRNHQAWLVRDDVFVHYLMDQLKPKKQAE
ncbi:oligoribonuclease NrnB/cAMP/cGMP phosphodiesterase (DHH superfamily) [Salirhabdus euzebyi]|uniref:Oligoribonuclease NrnB/cAMP/cGMP phosphodiesterase (DHH superfamily) n=2 Tax=Salirhabdus euzebyi TaxID=394506 RepID=A0A841Q4I5_9BACI|nr:oligoribonuclease NrnB/cAMP/cGMP phosphodiesterase (DHH superfamily) [Salirhabdus euzebyi]